MPSLPPKLEELLQKFAGAESPSAASLPDCVRRHLGEMREAARRNEMLPLDLAEGIAKGLLTLLAAPDLSHENRQLVSGAARYFVSNEDLLPDLHSPLGLDDDVLVFNSVATLLGRDDLRVDL